MRIMQTITDYIMRSILTTRGDMIVRGLSVPEKLVAVALGQVLKSGGVGAKPAWGVLTQENPIIVNPCEFMIRNGSVGAWYCDGVSIRNEGADTASRLYYAPVHIPIGVTVTRLRFHGYKEDAAAAVSVTLTRSTSGTLNVGTLAQAIIPGATGFQTVDDVSIDNAVITAAYHYFISLNINPNDSTADCYALFTEIAWSY